MALHDPECAIAYWGQAMSAFHLYWSHPSASELTSGKAALAQAAAAREMSPREDAYIEALRNLFDEYQPDSPDPSVRRFSAAMGQLVEQYSSDVEANAFYALSLLAAQPDGAPTLSNAQKAAAVLQPLLKDHRDHPGIAHYLIHACDHPGMAKQGLAAARRYASIAPAAPHALHMPSHIFARLGIWQDDIRSNLASKAAAETALGRQAGAENRLHAMEFLEYAYLQTGQFDQARAIVAEAKAVPRSEARDDDYYLTVQARIAATYTIETRDWAMAVHLAPVTNAHWYSEAHTLLANAMAAGHQHDAVAGVAAGQRLDALLSPILAKIGTLPAESSSADLSDEIHAWAEFSQGHVDRATNLLRPIAERQSIVGKGEVELPAREMLADMLLLDGRASQALKEYRTSLVSDPGRRNALAGARMAAEQASRDARHSSHGPDR